LESGSSIVNVHADAVTGGIHRDAYQCQSLNCRNSPVLQESLKRECWRCTGLVASTRAVVDPSCFGAVWRQSVHHTRAGLPLGLIFSLFLFSCSLTIPFGALAVGPTGTLSLTLSFNDLRSPPALHSSPSAPSPRTERTAPLDLHGLASVSF
jgi:hypothetical protein